MFCEYRRRFFFKFKDARKFCEREGIGPYRMSEMFSNKEMLLNREMLRRQICRTLSRKSEHEALEHCQAQETGRE